MSDNIKVMLTLDAYLPDVDGVINCVHNYCLNMKDDAELTVSVPKNRKDHVDDLPYRVLRCNSIHVPVLNIYYGFPFSDGKFKRSIDDTDVDIVHFHSPFGMGKFALRTARKKNVPLVATFHSNMRPIFKSVFKFNFLTEFFVKRLGKLYNECDEVFVCSKPVEEQLRSFGYTGKVTYLPFGTDFDKCEKVRENSLVCEKKFNIKPEKLCFVYIGRVMKLKRIDFILKALADVKKRGVDFVFYVVGKGAELNNLKKYAKSLGFTDSEVIFTGFLPREDYPLIASRADLLLFPSLYDNFGLVKLECASYETPGLYIEGSCAGDGIIDGENGFLSKDDPSSFAEKIIEASKDREKLKKIGVNAKNTLYIHWSDCTKILVENYKRIIAQHKKGLIKDDNQK